jgi:hypothetical protein
MFFAKQSTLSLVVIYGFLAISVTTLSPPLQAQSNSATPEVFGKSIGNWGRAWWQWALQYPADTNPVVTDGNVDYTLGQKGKVWMENNVVGLWLTALMKRSSVTT